MHCRNVVNMDMSAYEHTWAPAIYPHCWRYAAVMDKNVLCDDRLENVKILHF